MVSFVNAYDQNMKSDRVTLLIHLIFERDNNNKMFMVDGLPSNVKKPVQNTSAEKQ